MKAKNSVSESARIVRDSAAPIADAEQVVLRFSDMVYRLACVRCRDRRDAEDAFQNVFYRYLKYRPSFKSFEHQKAWFIRTTINCSNTILSGTHKKTVALNENLPLSCSGGIRSEIEAAVYDAVLRLPKKQKTAVHLHYYEGYSVAEIGKIMSVPQGTVKSWLSRARTALKEELKGEF